MSEKNKKSGIAFAAWCVAALILLIAFLVNGNKIIGNLKSTDFFEKVFGTGTTPEFIKNHKTEEAKSNGLLELEIETENSLQKPVIPQDPEELSQKEYVFQTPEKNESIESNRTETSVDEKLKETQVEAEKNKNQLSENDFLSAEKEISKPEKEPESVTKPAEKVEPAPAPAPASCGSRRAPGKHCDPHSAGAAPPPCGAGGQLPHPPRPGRIRQTIRKYIPIHCKDCAFYSPP